jgi:hypothetical protein
MTSYVVPLFFLWVQQVTFPYFSFLLFFLPFFAARTLIKLILMLGLEGLVATGQKAMLISLFCQRILHICMTNMAG